jgi:hypothetical protein
MEAPMTPTASTTHEPAWFSRWWIPLAALLLVMLYLPTLGTRFDFIDDGNLVYPEPPMPLGERVSVAWDKVIANYQHLGPFRPVVWAHWELAAEAFQGSELAWRSARLAWCGLSAAMLLWLLAELRVPRLAAFVAAAIAMWNPYRNEIWTSLTLSEGVAMPYALFALVCARRALTSRRPWAWDLAGAFAVLMALGCKNTFAALVPAQVFLRLASDNLSLRESWQRHGRRALVLALTLLAPIVHFVYFKLNWRAGQYDPAGPSLAQLERLLYGLKGGIAIDFLGIGLLLAMLAQLAHGRGWLGVARRHRTALLAGVLLLGAGVAVYLPIDAMSGRYTMPGIWGLDILIAIVLTGLLECSQAHLARLAWGLLAVGLVLVMASNVDKQFRFQTRARLLWQALETVERDVPRGAGIAWMAGDPAQGALDEEEGIHFFWHLRHRGRTDLRLAVVNDAGEVQVRRELPPAEEDLSFRIAHTPGGPLAGWQVRRLSAESWRNRHFECWLRHRGHAPVARRGWCGAGSPTAVR